MLLGEHRVDHAALVMAALEPRIREVHVHALDASRAAKISFDVELRLAEHRVHRRRRRARALAFTQRRRGPRGSRARRSGAPDRAPRARTGTARRRSRSRPRRARADRAAAARRGTCSKCSSSRIDVLADPHRAELVDQRGVEREVAELPHVERRLEPVELGAIDPAPRAELVVRRDLGVRRRPRTRTRSSCAGPCCRPGAPRSR